jgi:hypothetical protein
MNNPPNHPSSAATSTREATETKIDRPHAHFEQPGDVVVDPSLSKDEKTHALETLEQDARQLQTASTEGMTGGEDNKLQEVLEAKEALDLPPADVAMAVVIQNLKARLPETEGTEAHALIAHAIEAVEAASAAIAHMAPAPATPVAATPAGNPQPGSDAEIEAELQLEKLDP